MIHYTAFHIKRKKKTHRKKSGGEFVHFTDKSDDYTLNLNKTTSPSFITYSLPSLR